MSADVRPRTRGDCAGAVRPCPWVSCRYHLLLEVNPSTGLIRYNHTTWDVEQLAESCALDVADRGPHQYRHVGNLFGLSHERIRQIEEKALATMAKRGVILREYSDEGPVGKRRLPVLQEER